MADVRRDWRRRKPGSHTREVVKQELPAELVKMLADMAAALDALKAENADLKKRVAKVDNFLSLVSEEYEKRKAAA